MLNQRIKFDDILKIKPVLAERNEDIRAVKQRTACDYIINAGTYNMTTRNLDSGLKIDGKVLKSGHYGFGIKDNRLEWSYAGNWHKDWFEQFGLRDNSKRGRTGVGITKDELVLVAIADTDRLYKCGVDYFLKTYFKGCTHAINLDGGGSSQWIAPSSSFRSGRLVVWYLCVWLNPKQSHRRTVTARTGLRVRATPSILGKQIGLFKLGTVVTVTEIAKGWAKINSNGLVGWCSEVYLK